MLYSKSHRIVLAVVGIVGLAMLLPGQAQAGCNRICQGPNCGFNSNGGLCQERPFGCIEHPCIDEISDQVRIEEALKAALDALGDAPMTEEIAAALTDFPGARVVGLNGEILFEGPLAFDRTVGEGVQTACLSAEELDDDFEEESAD